MTDTMRARFATGTVEFTIRYEQEPLIRRSMDIPIEIIVLDDIRPSVMAEVISYGAECLIARIEAEKTRVALTGKKS